MDYGVRESSRSMHWGSCVEACRDTLPQTNMETHIDPFKKDCSLCRALFGLPC